MPGIFVGYMPAFPLPDMAMDEVCVRLISQLAAWCAMSVSYGAVFVARTVPTATFAGTAMLPMAMLAEAYS
jgi:hypothetical protein